MTQQDCTLSRQAQLQGITFATKTSLSVTVTASINLSTDNLQAVYTVVDHISVTASIDLSTNILQAVYTVVDHIFGGVLASRVQCQHCSQVSSVYDSMNDLSVEVDDGLYGVVKSVEVALAQFIKPEVMSGDNAYHCDWCQR